MNASPISTYRFVLAALLTFAFFRVESARAIESPRTCEDVFQKASGLKRISRRRIDSRVEIVHIAQQHSFLSYDREPPELRERTVESQFAQAQYILKNPGAIVFVEGWNHREFFSGKHWDNFFAERVLAAFPQGFPDSLEKLTEAQKSKLYEEGGAETLFYLGLIPRPLPTGSRFEKMRERQIKSEILLRSLSPGYKEWKQREVLDRREQSAVRVILQTVGSRSYGGQKIILVFGRSHNFSKYFVGYDVDFSRVETLDHK